MEKKIRQKIELGAAGKAKLAKTFDVTVQNVSQFRLEVLVFGILLIQFIHGSYQNIL